MDGAYGDPRNGFLFGDRPLASGSGDPLPFGRPALIDADSGERLSHADLAARVAAFQARLDLGRGVILLSAANTIESIVAYLAALRGGHPVILLDEKSVQYRDGYLGQFSVLYAYDPASDRLDRFPAHAGLALHPDLALLLSTSGSTGEKKFVRLSRQNLQANAESIVEYLGLTPADRAPTGLPMSYSYGLSVINSHLAVGASLLVTRKSVIDPAFWEAFDAHGCTSFAGVPQTFALLEQTGLADRPKPGLRYVTQAGGKLAPEKVTAWAERGTREGWDFYVMYGQTEAAPRISWLPPDLAAAHPASIGVPVPGGTIDILDEAGQPQPAGVEGELVYRGPNVMMGYAYGDADLVLGQGPDTLKTGDLGHKDARGLVYITGRRSRFIKISGKRIGLDAVETWMVAHGVQGAAAGRDDALGIILTPEGRAVLPDAAAALAQDLDLPRSVIHVVETDRLPFNQNGKLDLRACLALVEAQLDQTAPAAAAAAAGGDVAARQATVLALYQRQFPHAEIATDASFQSLGGSSNDFVDMEIALEQALGRLPTNWHVYSIQALAAHGQNGAAGHSLTDVFDRLSARTFCAMLVVLYHVIGDGPGSGLRLPPDSGLLIFNDILFYLRMPMFAFLAGMSFQQMGVDHLTPKRFFGNIALTMMVPTYLTIIAFAAFSTLLGTGFAIQGPGSVLNLILYPYAHFWFMQSLIVQLAVFYAALKLAPKAAPLVMGLAIALPVLTDAQFARDLFSVNGAIALAPYFGLGFLFSWRIEDVIAHRRPLMIAAAVIGAVMLAVAIWARVVDEETFGRRSLFTLVLASALILLCFAVVGRIPGLKRLAPFTFYIYLWHPFATSMTRRVLDMAGVDSLTVQVLAGLALGVSIPVLGCLILRRLPYGEILLGKT